MARNASRRPLGRPVDSADVRRDSSEERGATRSRKSLSVASATRYRIGRSIDLADRARAGHVAGAHRELGPVRRQRRHFEIGFERGEQPGASVGAIAAAAPSSPPRVDRNPELDGDLTRDTDALAEPHFGEQRVASMVRLAREPRSHVAGASVRARST